MGTAMTGMREVMTVKKRKGGRVGSLADSELRHQEGAITEDELSCYKYNIGIVAQCGYSYFT